VAQLAEVVGREDRQVGQLPGSERLLLRGLRGSDYEDYAALYADPENCRFSADEKPWDRGRAWRHMAFALGHWQLRGTGTWAVEEKASGAFLGMIGFWEPETWPGLTLGWELSPRHWGRGFATEGASAALAQAFLVWKRDRVISLISPPNLRSIRVAERIGERLEGPVEHGGRGLLCFGLDRKTYLSDVAPSRVTAKEPIRDTSPPGHGAPVTGTGTGHLSADVLRRFLEQQLSGPELHAVVRHLLTQCPECHALAERKTAESGLWRRQGGSDLDYTQAFLTALEAATRAARRLTFTSNETIERRPECKA
jgi:RimJ/RimL family protein N-acetyltransferase